MSIQSEGCPEQPLVFLSAFFKLTPSTNPRQGSLHCPHQKYRQAARKWRTDPLPGFPRPPGRSCFHGTQGICENRTLKRWALLTPLLGHPLSSSQQGAKPSKPSLLTALSFPQPPPQRDGPPAAGKQEAEERDRREEAKGRGHEDLCQGHKPNQNGAHPEGEAVQFTGMEKGIPGPTSKNGHYQVHWDAPLLRCVRRVLFATIMSPMVLCPINQTSNNVMSFFKDHWVRLHKRRRKQVTRDLRSHA